MYRVLFSINSENRRIERETAATDSLPASLDDIEIVALNVLWEYDVTDEGGRVRSADLYGETNFPESALSALETLEESGVTVVARREHSDRRIHSSKWRHVDADNIIICDRERIPVEKTLFGSVTQLCCSRRIGPSLSRPSRSVTAGRRAVNSVLPKVQNVAGYHKAERDATDDSE